MKNYIEGLRGRLEAGRTVVVPIDQLEAHPEAYLNMRKRINTAGFLVERSVEETLPKGVIYAPEFPPAVRLQERVKYKLAVPDEVRIDGNMRTITAIQVRDVQERQHEPLMSDFVQVEGRLIQDGETTYLQINKNPKPVPIEYS